MDLLEGWVKCVLVHDCFLCSVRVDVPNLEIEKEAEDEVISASGDDGARRSGMGREVGGSRGEWSRNSLYVLLAASASIGREVKMCRAKTVTNLEEQEGSESKRMRERDRERQRMKKTRRK